MLRPEQNPLELLQDYLEYYELCLQFPSPLMPNWGKALLEGSEEELGKEMEKENFTSFTDVYLEWIKLRNPSPSSHVVFGNWSETTRKLFSSFMSWRKNEV